MNLHFCLRCEALILSRLNKAILLVFAMIMVVGSWDFYFRSIDKHPLKDIARFVIDIVIVSFYIILLLSIRGFSNFLLYVNIIMCLYLLWDIFLIRAYPAEFGISRFDLRNVVSAYVNGFKSKGKEGPSITLWWFGMFAVLGVAHLLFTVDFIVIAIGSAWVYVLYRIDQNIHLRAHKRLAYSGGVLCVLVGLLLIERWIL